LVRAVDVKYFDQSYFLRGVPANCDDALVCDLSAGMQYMLQWWVKGISSSALGKVLSRISRFP
jgi:hypothetical protein